MPRPDTSNEYVDGAVPIPHFPAVHTSVFTTAPAAVKVTGTTEFWLMVTAVPSSMMLEFPSVVELAALGMVFVVRPEMPPDPPPSSCHVVPFEMQIFRKEPLPVMQSLDVAPSVTVAK